MAYNFLSHFNVYEQNYADHDFILLDSRGKKSDLEFFIETITNANSIVLRPFRFSKLAIIWITDNCMYLVDDEVVIKKDLPQLINLEIAINQSNIYVGDFNTRNFEYLNNTEIIDDHIFESFAYKQIKLLVLINKNILGNALFVDKDDVMSSIDHIFNLCKKLEKRKVLLQEDLDAFENLNTLTNKYSSLFLSYMLSVYLPAKILLKTKGLIGDLNKESVAEIINKLETTGIFSFDITSSNRLVSDLKSKLSQLKSVNVNNEPISGIDILNINSLQDLISDHSILNISNTFLKSSPILEINNDQIIPNSLSLVPNSDFFLSKIKWILVFDSPKLTELQSKESTKNVIAELVAVNCALFPKNDKIDIGKNISFDFTNSTIFGLRAIAIDKIKVQSISLQQLIYEHKRIFHYYYPKPKMGFMENLFSIFD